MCPSAGVKVVVTSPECFDPLAITDDCGVSASSALDEDTLPGNVIEEDETYWAPAIRSACGHCHPVISSLTALIGPDLIGNTGSSFSSVSNFD